MRSVARRRSPPAVGVSDPAPGGVAHGLLPAVLLVVVSLVDRAETSITSGVLPLLQAEWGFSDGVAGTIPAAALAAGMVLVLPAGYLADRANRTRVLALVVASWSVITLGSAVAISLPWFFATRVVLGGADAIDNPLVSSLVADYYPPASRARVFGYQRVSFGVGAALGTVIGGVVGEAFGWRWAFAMAIVPGLLVAAAVARLSEPIRGGMDRHTPRRVRAHREVPATVGDRWRAVRDDLARVARVPTVRFLFPGVAIFGAALSAISFWLPSFFVRVHGLGEGRASALAAGIVGVGSLAGAIVGGEIGDRRHGPDRATRMTIMVVGMGTGLVLFAVGAAVGDLGVASGAMFVGMGFLGMVAPAYPSVTADVIPASRRGAGYAALQLVILVGLGAGSVALGVVSDLTGSLRTAFLLMLPLSAVGLLLGLGARQHYVRDMGRLDGPPPDGAGAPAGTRGGRPGPAPGTNGP